MRNPQRSVDSLLHVSALLIPLSKSINQFTKRGVHGYSNVYINKTLMHIIMVVTYSCLATDPQPLPKRVLHRQRSIAYSLNFHNFLVSLSSSSSSLRLLQRFLPFVFSFSNVFQKEANTQDVTNPLHCIKYVWDVPFLFDCLSYF